MSILHEFRGGVEISSATVVTEPLPGVENVVFRGHGKRGKIRKATEPTIIVGQHGRDLRLLKHELGDEDRVWIARATPGKIAAMAPKPAE